MNLNTVRKMKKNPQVTPRRCFLFAAYYSNNKVDKADLYHLEQLSRLGDIYYFVDSDYFSPREVLKIQHMTKYVGWEKHGEYDFGSWKRLFAKIEDDAFQYDEIFLVNNSCYLVGDLSPTLSAFSASEAEFFAPCIIDDNYVGQSLHYEDYFHRFSAYHDNAMFSSIFIGFKKSLAQQPYIRNFFSSVKKQYDRLQVCITYERGLTRTILRNKVQYHVAHPFVLKNSYIYSRDSFTLVRDGFPYLKRKVLNQEFYKFDLPQYRVLGLLKSLPASIAEIIDEDYSKIKKTDTLLAESIFIEQIFDAEWYLDRYPDVKTAQIGGLSHYLRFGITENRQPCEWLNLENHAWGFPSKDPTVFIAFLNHLESFLKYDFQASWYENEYANIIPSGVKPLQHYFETGWKIGCRPFENCELDYSVSVINPASGTNFNPYFYFVQDYDKFTHTYRTHQRQLASNLANAKTLYIFFNVARDVIGGGMLSINRFAKRTHELTKNDPSKQVAISNVPLLNEAVKHTQFEPFAEQIDFRLIVEQCRAEDIHMFIPEVFAIEFEAQLNQLQRKWIYSRKSVNITILNQNTDLMPPADLLQQCFSSLPAKLNISTAHKSYCTQRLASQYCLPVKQLTPYLPAITQIKKNRKENIIMVSPDQIERGSDGLTRDEVIKLLAEALPEYRFVMVQNLTVDLYLELASIAMFSITFGEGLDGYFIEPILSGGVSFAVFNSAFFPKEMADCPTLYNSWANLIAKIKPRIQYLADNDDAYESLSSELQEIIRRQYSQEISDGDLISLLNRKYDYFPGAKLRDTQAIPEGPSYLQNIPGMKVTNCENRVHSVRLPSGDVMDHFGGYSYIELSNCYSEKLYSLSLDKKKSYVLIDATASAAFITNYLLDQHQNIKSAYVYEGADQSAILTQRNIKNSSSADRINFKQIFLADQYRKKVVSFRREWASFVSPHIEASNAYVEDQSRGSEDLRELSELETANASDEIAAIYAKHPNSRLILRINNEVMAKIILSELNSSGQLAAVSLIILTIPFIKEYPDELLLTSFGFEMEPPRLSRNFDAVVVVARRRDLH